MDLFYLAVAFLAVPGLLVVLARLSRRPDLPRHQPPPRHQPESGHESVADEAERWLSSQN